MSELHAPKKGGFNKKTVVSLDANLLDAYQQFVEDIWWTGDDRPHAEALAIMAMGLVGEAGETVDHLKKAIRGRRDPDLVALKAELGDVLYYLSKVANHYGIALQEVMKANMAKLQARKAEKDASGKGLK